MTKPAKYYWVSEPISRTCHVSISGNPLKRCGKPTTHAYPALYGGWATLCQEHAKKHLPHGCTPTDELIARGETWE